MLTADAEAALARGELKVRRLLTSPGGPAAVLAKNITLRVAEQDLARARELAAKRGLRHQTYVKMLLDEAWTTKKSGPAVRLKYCDCEVLSPYGRMLRVTDSINRHSFLAFGPGD
jgi:hypothetical protein